MRARWWGAALGFALTAAACSSAEPRRPSAATAVSSAKPAAGPAREATARWDHHPAFGGAALATMRLADGRCLVTDDSGLRWLVSPAPGDLASSSDSSENEVDPDAEEEEVSPRAATSKRCSGFGRAATDRTAEQLVGIVKRPGGVFWFIGQSGIIHETRSPLGVFTRHLRPPEPVHLTAGSGATFLAATVSGRLLRWEDEGGYQRVDMGGAHIFDVAVAPNGRAVALGLPEAIFTTEDGGRHFARAAAPSMAVARVSYTPGGSFLVAGIGDGLAWDPRGPVSFAKTAERFERASIEAAIETGTWANPDHVVRGAGALDGESYWGPRYERGEWWLERGKLDGRSSPTPGVGGDENDAVAVAARDRRVVVAVRTDNGGPSKVELKRSHDAATTFDAGYELTASGSETLGLALSSEGSVLLLGACTDDALGDDAACERGVVVWRGDAPPRMAKGPVVTWLFGAPVFSADGRSAYFVGRQEDTDAAGLFVSHDGGASFEERELSADDGELHFYWSDESRLTVSERGTVGIVLRPDSGPSDFVYVTTDSDGRNVRAGVPPDSDARLGGFGERVLALGLEAGRRGEPAKSATVSESHDGGATWTEVPSPRSLKSAVHSRTNIACSAAGCLVGTDFTRLGWGAGGEVEVAKDEPEPQVAGVGLRTPIVCEPQSGSSWTRLDHVVGRRSFPDEHEAMRGRAAWSLSTLDQETGAATVVTAMLPESGDGEPRIVTKPLFKALPASDYWATMISSQIEGFAAARVRMERAALDAGGRGWTGRRIKNLDVVWENYEEGSSGHVVLPDAGLFDASSTMPTGESDYELRLSLLSITPGGIFVRATTAEPNMVFAATSGKTRLLRVPEWPEPWAAQVRFDEAVNVDGTLLAMAQVQVLVDGAPDALLLARPKAKGEASAEPWSFYAAAIAPEEGTSSVVRWVDWTYDGGHLATWTLVTTPAQRHATAFLRRPLADGTLAPAVRLPTPFDLGATPRPCSAEERKRFPRLRVSDRVSHRILFPGAQHPVLISETAPATPRDKPSKKPIPRPPIGNVEMLTSGFVLRGTPASPCVDAFSAVEPRDNRMSVLMLGDLRRGWFFRLVVSDHPDDEDAPEPPLGSIEVRPLTCRFDPGATVPDHLANIFRVR